MKRLTIHASADAESAEREAFLRRLYFAVERGRAREFSNRALRLLAAKLEFDQGYQATVNLRRSGVSFDANYGQLKSLDDLRRNPIFSAAGLKTLADKMKPGIPVAIALDRSQSKQQSTGRSGSAPSASDRQYCIVAHLEPHTTALHILVMGRIGSRGFTEPEQFHAIGLMPHLVALKIKSLIIEKSPVQKSPGQHAVVICEEDGDLYYLQDEARHLLMTTFPDWSSTRLPVELPRQYGPFSLEQGMLLIRGRHDAGVYVLYLSYRDALSTLTQRERSIVELARLGTATKLIARELALSPSTVSNHLQRVYTKLGIRSRAELATLAQMSEVDSPL